MILYSRDLPSGGLLGGSNSYEIRPLTFLELIRRKSSPEITPLRTYVKNLLTLIEMDKRIEDAPIVDSKYLIYLMSMLTINEKMTFNNNLRCPHCGKVIRITYSTTDVTPRKITTIAESITLKGQQYKITMPSIKQFLEFVDQLPPFSDDWDLDRIELYSLLHDHKNKPIVGIAIHLVDSAVYDEITSLSLVEKSMLSALDDIELVCEHCKGGIAIEPLSSVADMFRLVIQSNPVDPNKVHFRQICETSES